MRAKDTSSPGEWRGAVSWLRHREQAGGPTLLCVTSGVTTCVVLAITLLALVEELWMVGVAFLVLVMSIAAITGFIAVMLADREGQ